MAWLCIHLSPDAPVSFPLDPPRPVLLLIPTPSFYLDSREGRPILSPNPPYPTYTLPSLIYVRVGRLYCTPPPPIPLDLVHNSRFNDSRARLTCRPIEARVFRCLGLTSRALGAFLGLSQSVPPPELQREPNHP